VEILLPVVVSAGVAGGGLAVVGVEVGVVGVGVRVVARREEMEEAVGVSPGRRALWNVRAGRSCARFRV
jgi:hypothetical protein